MCCSLKQPLLQCVGSAVRWRRRAPGADVFLCCHWLVLLQVQCPEPARNASRGHHQRVTTYSSIPLEMCTEQSLWLPSSCLLVTRSEVWKGAELLPKPWGSQKHFQPNSSCSSAGAAPCGALLGPDPELCQIHRYWHIEPGICAISVPCAITHSLPLATPSTWPSVQGLWDTFLCPAMPCLMLQSCLGSFTTVFQPLLCPA